ncbi:MAG TPA: NADH-quinone oxidoreductase subunit C [Acidobacteriaceae bacterium]|jgi:NADH-quinone oxidoreductase subunit C|nr:NADH-quinone oxidoreductase subunit C [Acidobacteriaceae bacterium]
MGGTPTPLPVPNPGPTAQSPGPHPGPEPGPSGTGQREYPKEAIFGKDAVFAAMPWNEAVQAVTESAIDAKWDRRELTISVARENIVPACEAVKAAGYNFFEDLTAVDWYPQEPRIQLSYHIVSYGLKQRVRLAVRLDSADLTVDSITSVWPSSNFYEREIFDLFGVKFSGHPGLTRIMMPPDWKGHPLRKDYPVEGYR